MRTIPKLLQTILREASTTPDQSASQDLIAQALSPYGFKAYPIESNGVKNLFLIRQGESKTSPHLAFAGHTDVVPTGPISAWKHPPFNATLDKNHLYGRGIADMKGAIIAYILALQNFLDQTPNFKATLSLMIAGDEEGDAKNGTIKIIDFLHSQNIKPDACLVGEPTSNEHLGDCIKIGRRGSLNGTLTIHGYQGHVAYPEKATNPIPELTHLTSILTDHVFDHGTDQFQASHFEATGIETDHKASNIIPHEVKLHFNIRFNPLHTAHILERELHRLIGQHKTLPYSLECTSNAEAFLSEPTKITTSLITAIRKNASLKPHLSTSGGTSDARFIQKLCPIAEFGLRNQSIHQIDEHISLKDFEMLGAIYLDFLKDFF